MKRILSLILVATAVLIVSALPASAITNLVTNGGFENGDFTGWTHSGDGGYDTIVSSSSFVHTGVYGALLGPINPQASLYQILDTIPGQTYSISFWLKNDGGITPDNDFTAYWGNTSNTLFSGQDLGDSPFTEYTYLQVASSATTQFGFSYFNFPSYFGLDDVSVAPVPIPGALILFGSGLMGLVGVARNRLKR